MGGVVEPTDDTSNSNELILQLLLLRSCSVSGSKHNAGRHMASSQRCWQGEIVLADAINDSFSSGRLSRRRSRLRRVVVTVVLVLRLLSTGRCAALFVVRGTYLPTSIIVTFSACVSNQLPLLRCCYRANNLLHSDIRSISTRMHRSDASTPLLCGILTTHTRSSRLVTDPSFPSVC